LRKDVVESIKTNFLDEFEKTVNELKMQLRQNQGGQLTSTVQMQRLIDTRVSSSITISGQELFYSKMKSAFDTMVRKAQSDQLS